jgi:transcriptional regulator with XRE-family HTH domain
MKRVRLDLFKLHEEKDRGQGRIKIIPNDKFLTKFNEILKEMEVYGVTQAKLAKMLGIHPDLLTHYKNDRKIPLGTLIKILKFWKLTTNKSDSEFERKKFEIQDHIEEVSHSTGRLVIKTYCPKFLSINLCKICGAIVADGNLQLSRNSIGCSYVIRAYDQYKDNIDTLCALIYSEFRVKVQPKFDKKENYWFIKFGNKVIFRYLNKIFDIPIGDKSSIVRMPKIIKDSHISYQIAFVSGFMMFDGGVHFNQARFSLGTKSKMLYEDIKQVLESLKLYPDYTNEKITKPKDVFSIEIGRKTC